MIVEAVGQQRAPVWLPPASWRVALPVPLVMGVAAEDCAWHPGGPPRQLPAEVGAAGRKARDMPTSISFEGCGAAISYHLAVYEAACRAYGRQRLQSKKVKFVGTSSGSIAALIAALGLDAQIWKERLLQLWVPMGVQCKGLLQVDYYVGLALDEILASFPGNAAEHLTGRLFVSMTHFPMKNVMVSDWKSNGHIKKCILASCFIPVAFLRPVPDGKCVAIDGGFSLNNPRLDASTCLVSPTRTPGADIMPVAKARFRDLIGAPDPERFTQIWEGGLGDGRRYFQPASVSREAQEEAMNRQLDSPPKQSFCGRCYFWAMKQPACMAVRIGLFWSLLLAHLLALPLCLVSWLELCPSDPDSDQGLGKVGGGLGGAGPACCCPPRSPLESPA